MSDRLIPLGTNGYIPTHGRHTACYLYLTPQQALMIDAGTGVARLADPGVQALLEPYDRLDLILSHYHLDHVIGLFYLAGMWRRGSIRLYVPGPPFVESDPEEALSRFFAPPFAAPVEDMFKVPAETIVYTAGRLKIGSLNLRLWPQRHPGGSAGFRIDDRIVYASDKAVEPVDSTGAHGVERLLHEVWLTEEEAGKDPDALTKHSTVGQVAEWSRAAGVGRLMPIHHHPRRTEQDLQAMARELEERSGVTTEVPREGEVYEL